MYLDAETRLSNAQAVTTTVIATNAYDMGAAAVSGGVLRDPGTGEPLCIAVSVGVAADFTTGDETYEFDIVTSTASDGTTGQLIIAKYVVLATNLTIGKLLVLPIPPLMAQAVAQRWLTLKYVVGGTTPTITCTAWITQQSMIDAVKYYPTLISIS